MIDVSFVVLDKKSELSYYFIEASSKIGRKKNTCKPSKERARTCKD